MGEYVARYYMPEIPPYFCEYHESTILDVLNDLLGKTRYEYIKTDVVLPEPICSEPRSERVYLSMPLIARYINLPTNLPRIERVQTVRGFNAFDDIELLNHTGKPSLNARFCLTARQTSNSETSHMTLGEKDEVVCVQLFRVMIMLQHWWQHRRDATYPYDIGTCHRTFVPIEFAQRESRTQSALTPLRASKWHTDNFNDDAGRLARHGNYGVAGRERQRLYDCQRQLFGDGHARTLQPQRIKRGISSYATVTAAAAADDEYRRARINVLAHRLAARNRIANGTERPRAGYSVSNTGERLYTGFDDDDPVTDSNYDNNEDQGYTRDDEDRENNE